MDDMSEIKKEIQRVQGDLKALYEKKQQLEQENEIDRIPSDGDQNRSLMGLFDPPRKCIKPDQIETILFVKMRQELDETNTYYKLPVIHVLRRQLNSLVSGVYDKEQKIEDFLYWYVVDNSVKDFNLFKNYLLNLYGNRLSVTYTDIVLNFEPSNTGNTVIYDVVCTAIEKFFDRPHIIRADVKVLHKLFTPGYDESIVIDAPTSDTLRDVYRYVKESYDTRNRPTRHANE
ncbi:Hypothetical protein CINCED_3A011688 [Cinara cedri]|uniref:Uncharacterized protein n=1 Tax=Cinara cedri TaxID=506608 RepID=A0A5E4MTC1_9HEMI|nr:Hypothetical protein CINCED_3A011688 [Cinara cedri]